MKKLRITIDNQAYDVQVEILDSGLGSTPPLATPILTTASVSAPVVSAPAAAAPKAAAGASDVPSPLAGKVVSVDVQPGQAVTEGTQLATVEAMKMNTYINAPRAGTVTAVNVKPGDSVEEGTSLLRLE